MMAIVLNDVFLSMGFKSRVIHGNSKHYIFFAEWHAFNTVYVNSLQKWIYIDPTFQSCYTNDGGQYLSIAEIREYLIQDRAMFLHPQADYNGEPISQDDNLHYLSKNFYRFSCSLHSGFGLNCFGYTSDIISFTYVHLDPQGEQQYGLSWAEDNNTTNPVIFWQKQ